MDLALGTYSSLLGVDMEIGEAFLGVGEASGNDKGCGNGVGVQAWGACSL